MENEINNSEDKIALDINNIELFLIKSGYLSQKIWTKNNSDWFDWSKYNELLLSFEYNEKISATEASVKYGDKIQWMNKIFKIDTTLDELHRQYLHYTSTNISFIKLLNSFIMLEIILKDFYNVINGNNEQDINVIFNEKIIMNDIDMNSSLRDTNVVGLKKKLESIYTKINNNSTYNGKDVNSKIITILFLLSMGSSFSVDQNIPQMTNLMNIFTLYNKIYINDIHLSFILFLNIIASINLCIYVNKKKNHFNFLKYDNNNYTNYFYQEMKKKNNADKNNNSAKNKENYLTFSFFDNEIITYSGDIFCEIIKFQNCLKIYSLYQLSKNQIKMTINLTIDTMVETLKTFSDNFLININIIKNLFNININNNNSIYKLIKLNNLILLSKNNINKCFSSFNFNELLIKVTNFREENQIQLVNVKYLELIQKTQKLYFQNSITTINQIDSQKNINNNNNEQSDVSHTIDDNSSIDILIKEFKVLNYLLHYYKKNKETKTNLQFYCFKFRFFKCSIFKENKNTKEIQIFFDYSSIKEKLLLKYLKVIDNILFLIKQYEQILNILNEYKLYNIIFRVSQTNFRSRHINYYFTIIIRKLVFFIDENKYNRITLYDSKLKIYDQNMLVYIKDDTIKQKTRINTLKEMFNDSFFNNKLKLFNNYLKELADDWDLIIIGENINNHNLIYNNNENILFINIVKEGNDNSVQNFMAGSSVIKMSVKNLGVSVNPMGQIDDKINTMANNLVNYEYLNIIMYIENNEDFAEKVLKFAENLKNSSDNILSNKITLICQRFFFEEKIIMNARVKEGKQIYNCIDNYFLVCDIKKNGERYKYDVYITKSYISVVNHFNQEITNNFTNLIYSFISVLSSCIEIIIYLLKNKEVDWPSKFFYIQKIHKNYFLFEYKMGNIFVKKIQNFDSLILLNVKKTIPLFCLFTEKQIDDDNEFFMDLFLRLFLNLNKVVEVNQLNDNFFEKIHKNMFFQNYDIFKLIALSYDAFCTFNDFFVNNNYLQISKNDKFETCYIMPYEVESEQKNIKFNQILERKNKNELIVKNIIIYDFNLTNSFKFNNVNDLKMNYQKAEFFVHYYEKPNVIQISIKDKLIYVYQKLISKKTKKNSVKKILKNIKELFFEKDTISLYSSNTSDFSKVLFEFNTELVKIKAVKLDHRSFNI